MNQKNLIPLFIVSLALSTLLSAEDAAVTIDNKKDKLGPLFTFKGGEDCRIPFDSVRLWDCSE